MLRCMRTTINLDDDVLAEAKRLALHTGRTLGRTIEELLREGLARRSDKAVRGPVELPVVTGGRVLAGVDFDDNAALLDHMERDDGAA